MQKWKSIIVAPPLAVGDTRTNNWVKVREHRKEFQTSTNRGWFECRMQMRLFTALTNTCIIHHVVFVSPLWGDVFPLADIPANTMQNVFVGRLGCHVCRDANTGNQGEGQVCRWCHQTGGRQECRQRNTLDKQVPRNKLSFKMDSHWEHIMQLNQFIRKTHHGEIKVPLWLGCLQCSELLSIFRWEPGWLNHFQCIPSTELLLPTGVVPMTGATGIHLLLHLEQRTITWTAESMLQGVFNVTTNN